MSGNVASFSAWKKGPYREPFHSSLEDLEFPGSSSVSSLSLVSVISTCRRTSILLMVLPKWLTPINSSDTKFSSIADSSYNIGNTEILCTSSTIERL